MSMIIWTYEDWWSGVEPNVLGKNDRVELEGGVQYLKCSTFFLSEMLPNIPLI